MVQSGARRQAERSRRTRERVVASTARLICKEGLPSASPHRITQSAGMSWGAVQHHFGSKEQLLKTIVLLSRDQFVEAVKEPDYSGLDLASRIALYADVAWRHYQSDVFLASVEISFWQRNNGFAIGEDVARDEGRTSDLTRSMLADVFAGTGAEVERLAEASEYMHCVLTGLAFQKILTGESNHLAHHLAHCCDAMVKIVLDEDA